MQPTPTKSPALCLLTSFPTLTGSAGGSYNWDTSAIPNGKFISGKRYLAHEHEPGAFEAPGIYWYEPLVVPKPIGSGQLQWVRHVIDYGTRTGAGIDLAARPTGVVGRHWAIMRRP